MAQKKTTFFVSRGDNVSEMLFLNSTQQDITDVGADTSYVRIYISNLIKNFVTLKLLLIGFRFRSSQL